MPIRAPHICGCGARVPFGSRCACRRKSDTDRKARHDARRQNSSARGYNGSWDKARALFLKRNPLCRMCGAPATVVDHIRPHRGDQSKFWDRANWQALCARDHNSTKQRAERRAESE